MGVWSEVNLSKIELTRWDAEFYRPKYLKIKNKLRGKRLKSYGVSVMHPAEFTRNYEESGLILLLAQNNRTNFYDWNEIRYVSENLKCIINRNELKSGDVTVTRTGANYGQTSVISNELNDQEVYACADLLIIRSQEIDGHLISTYLNTDIGRDLLDRGAYGAAQPHLAPSYLKEIPFPEYLLKIESEVSSLVVESKKLASLSKLAYRKANNILSSELNIEELNCIKPLGYTSSFSDVMNSNRMDADFFQIPYIKLHQHLHSLRTAPLADLVYFRKGIEVGSKLYSEQGKHFLRVSNITIEGIELGSSDKYISEKLFNSLANFYQPKPGEILLTKDGTVGTCFVVDNEVDGVISGGVVRLLPKANDIPSEYLALVINSKICRMQIEQECSGALILHWKPSSIRKLKIPLLSLEKMKQISELVVESKRSMYESKKLLEEAKLRVEELIEKES